MLVSHRKTVFEKLWNRVRDRYELGYCVSERGLQAALFFEISDSLQDSAVIVEPTWIIAGRLTIPDLVIVENDLITDIFELKFVPHGCADSKSDLKKLLSYRTDSEERHPIHLDPQIGAWDRRMPIGRACQLHFVAVSSYEAAAVWPESLPSEASDLAAGLHEITHWYGRVGGNTDKECQWGIQWSI